MDGTGPLRPVTPQQPTLAELLSRCDFARLHPERLREVCRKWEIGGEDALEGQKK